MAQYAMDDYMPPNKYVWDWGPAVLLRSIIMYSNTTDKNKKSDIVKYVKECIETTKDKENGQTPNRVTSGHALVFLALETGEEEYVQRATKIFEDYKNIVRSSNNGVSHRNNTIELWDDTIYVLGMYFLEMYRLTKDEKYAIEFTEQLVAHYEKLVDPEWGLWYHGWDQDTIPFDDHCSQFRWANIETGKSSQFWGRGNGWIAMACADALEILPATYDGYDKIAEIYKELLHRLPELQDTETGHWYQLPIYPENESNWIESSCTAMFGYAMAKGIKLGILPKKDYQETVERAYKGLIEHSLLYKNDSKISTKNVCIGTCIGDENYYFNRKQVEGTTFGIGAFIMFGLEYGKVR